MGRKALSAFAKAKKRNKSEEATLPSALLDEIGPSPDTAVSGPTWTCRPSCSQHTWAPQPDSNISGDACAPTAVNEQCMAWSAPHESGDHNIRQQSVLEPSAAAGRSMRANAADFSSASPTGTADLHAIGRLLNPCVCALLRHVGSVLIVIGSAGLGGDDERGGMGEVGGVGSRQ